MTTGDRPTYAQKHIAAVEADINTMRETEKVLVRDLEDVRASMVQARRLLSFIKQQMGGGPADAGSPPIRQTPVPAAGASGWSASDEKAFREAVKDADKPDGDGEPKPKRKTTPMSEYIEAVGLMDGEFTAKEVADLVGSTPNAAGLALTTLAKKGILFRRVPDRNGARHIPPALYRKRR